MADAPQLFFIEPDEILRILVDFYEQESGKKIYPAQVEMLNFSSIRNLAVIINARLDSALSQLLIQFSTGSMLDQLVGTFYVTRLDSVPSVTTLALSLQAGHGGVVIPAGTRVGSTDGRVTFATDTELVVAPGVLSAVVDSTATLDGSFANNYPVGTINVIVDARPYLVSATNTTVTSAGAEQETDENLRERYLLSLSRSATAGSADSYKYHARSANPSIVDVEITTTGADVYIYPLLNNGEVTPQAILDAVFAAVNPETVRPLNDKPHVLSPTKITYELNVRIILKKGVILSTNRDLVTSAISAFAIKKSKKLGEDITESQLTAAGMNENVYDISFDGFTDIVVDKKSFAALSAINIVSVTYENE